LLAKDRAEKRTGVSVDWRELSICHGFGLHFRRMPKAHPARPAMARLAKLFDEFERDFAGSPISFALKRMGVPRFHLVYPGVEVKPNGQLPRLPRGPAGSGRTGPKTGK
jgi:hypothetical protein